LSRLEYDDDEYNDDDDGVDDDDDELKNLDDVGTIGASVRTRLELLDGDVYRIGSVNGKSDFE